MKVVDYSVSERKKTGALGDALSRLNLPLSKKEVEAQEVIIKTLKRLLDNQYVMLCNVTLQGLDVPVSLILVGPSGVRVIHTSDVKGVFRAKDDVWEELDNRTQAFKTAKPNLLSLTASMAEAVSNYLSNKDVNHPEVEAVVFFSNPGVHVDSSRPIARIVLADALERFAASMLRSRSILGAPGVQKIVDTLGSELKVRDETEDLMETRDAFSFQEPPKERSVIPTALADSIEEEPAFFKKISFTRRQWILLIAMLVVNIVILVAFVLIILISV